jgi:hypothetical protein
MRRWSAIRRHLLRKRAMLTLLVLLAVGLGEPLLCIVHCQIWLPLAFHSYFATQHPHAHHGATHTAAASTSQPAAQTAGVAIDASMPAQPTLCAFQAGPLQGSVPFHVPPSPVHDLLPVLLLVLCLPIVARARLAAPPRDPPRACSAPPFRPPILSAM